MLVYCLLSGFWKKLTTQTERDTRTRTCQKTSPSINRIIDIIYFANYRNNGIKTSLPYFRVKLSCVCLMFAYRKKSNDL